MSKEFAKGKKGPKGNNPMKTLKRCVMPCMKKESR